MAKVDRFDELARPKAYFSPGKYGVPFILGGRYRYREYSDEFRRWLDEQTGDVRKIFGKEGYEMVHTTEDSVLSVDGCVFLASVVDGDFSLLCRLPDWQLIDVLKQPTKEESHG